jgi:hypothetical protein
VRPSPTSPSLHSLLDAHSPFLGQCTTSFCKREGIGVERFRAVVAFCPIQQFCSRSFLPMSYIQDAVETCREVTGAVGVGSRVSSYPFVHAPSLPHLFAALSCLINVVGGGQVLDGYNRHFY